MNDSLHKLFYSLTQKANNVFDRIFSNKKTSPIVKNSFFRCLNINSQLNGSQIEKELLKENIRCFSSEHFRINNSSSQNFLRVSLSATNSIDELEYGLKKLKEYLIEKELLIK